MKSIISLCGKYSMVMCITVILSACQSGGDGPREASPEVVTFAQCITAKGATFYGTERCTYCKQQKALFGTAMSGINFVDCDQNQLACKAAGISGYPTRQFTDKTTAGGLQTFEQLSVATGCPVPVN